MKTPPPLRPAEVERLALVAEEAGEIVQAVAKILRHGWENRFPDDAAVNNRDDLEKEIGDLLAAVHIMDGQDIDGARVEAWRDRKLTRIGKRLHYHEPVK